MIIPCAPHTVEVRTGPGSVGMICTQCKAMAAVLYTPEDEIERILDTLEDQAKKQIGPAISGYSRERAARLVAARMQSGILEATGTFAPPKEMPWVREVRAQSWVWPDEFRDKDDEALHKK